MANPRIMGLLASDAAPSTDMSSTASTIISSAVAHQETASESRIGVQVRRGNARPEPVGLSRFKNSKKLRDSGTISIRTERKDKKADWTEQKAMTGPKFSVTLWKGRGIEEKSKQV